MKAIVFVGFCLLVTLASARLRGEVNAYPSQSFLLGMHAGMALTANTSTVALVDDSLLSPNTLVYGLSYLSYPSPGDRYVGVQTLYAIFYRLAYALYQPISADRNFSAVMNYTLTDLSDPVQFQYRADVYKRNTGIDVFTKLAYASQLALAQDFYNSGVSFGNVIYLLSGVLLENEQAILETTQTVSYAAAPQKAVLPKMDHLDLE
eukprot:TRINITY_DN1769_c0_g1_i1.p1 TRINITY_DN1769_c0_g1~~TRINITY_DN1769_c0_g1_i1.p1  ORF type:complete len:206 (-),score=43.33 TRINITY_DN1769_c0_g1_i1:152-769(-)